MLTNRSPPKTTNLAAAGGVSGSQQHSDDNVAASGNDAGNIPSKDTQFGQFTNRIHPPLGYSFLPLRPPVPLAPQF
jgi:hypothetical protein